MNDRRLDDLAIERTRLANERTLLAYVRTALALSAGGAAMMQFMPNRPDLVWLEWLLVISGVLALVVGVHRFLRVRSRLR